MKHTARFSDLLSTQIRNSKKFKPEIELTVSQWLELAALCLLNLRGKCRDIDAAIACECSPEVIEVYRRILRGWDISGIW
jgi:hypothetical protein